jgi:hypothetical protein
MALVPALVVGIVRVAVALVPPKTVELELCSIQGVSTGSVPHQRPPVVHIDCWPMTKLR